MPKPILRYFPVTRDTFRHIFFYITKPHSTLKTTAFFFSLSGNLRLDLPNHTVADEYQNKDMFIVQIKKLTTKGMSSRMYNLQPRQGTDTPAQSGNLASASHSPHRDVLPHAPIMAFETDRTTALYSDVVASRPPSPRKETKVLTTSNAKRYLSNRNTPSEGVIIPQNEGTGSISSYENDTPGLDRDNGMWTTVRRRHACSLDSLNNTTRYVNKKKLFLQEKLTREQVQAVNAAESHLTASQKEMI